MTNTIKPHALDFFKKELNHVQDSTLQAFFYNALAVAPQSFHDDESVMLHTKEAFYVLKGMLESRHVQGTVKDALLGTVLICDIMLNEFDESMSSLHTVAVRQYLDSKKVNQDIQQGLWENIMRAVESHHGDKGASPLLDAKPGTAEYEIAQAFAMVSLGYLTIDWEVIYNEATTEDEVTN
jgi:hypothetical protein